MADQPKTPPAPDSPPGPTHVVVTADAATYRKGMILPNTPEIAKALSGKSRPATPHDLGVAGMTTRG